MFKNDSPPRNLFIFSSLQCSPPLPRKFLHSQTPELWQRGLRIRSLLKQIASPQLNLRAARPRHLWRGGRRKKRPSRWCRLNPGSGGRLLTLRNGGWSLTRVCGPCDRLNDGGVFLYLLLLPVFYPFLSPLPSLLPIPVSPSFVILLLGDSPGWRITAPPDGAAEPRDLSQPISVSVRSFDL